MSSVEFKQVSQWIRQRQSVFPSSFTGNKVSDELIQAILLNANNAPSHRNTEPWRFKVVSPQSLNGFVEFCQQSYKSYYKEAGFIERKYNKIASKISKSSHILIITMQRDLTNSVPEWEELAAVACAVENIYLSLTAAGLGGYWSTPNYLIENINSYVILEEQERCLGLFYIGELSDKVPPQKEKKPIENKIQWL